MVTFLAFLALSVVGIVKKLFKEKNSYYLGFASVSVFVLASAAMLVSDVYMVFTLGSVFFWTLLGYAINEEENKETIVYKLFNFVFSQKRGK